MKRIVTGSMLTLIALSILTMASNIEYVKASGTIYIRANGSVDPPTAPISTFDNIIYTLTDNINDSIVVERSNIIIDGNGYSLQGSGSGDGFAIHSISNVTIKNTAIKNFEYGIYLDSTSQNVIIGNDITANSKTGILLYSSSNNSVSNNKVTANNWHGIMFDNSSNNSVNGNNITANTEVGILLYSSSNYNSVSGNKMTANNISAVSIVLSSNNSLYGNNITENNVFNAHGIWLDYSSNHNIVTGNNITTNYFGIKLHRSSSHNIVSGNSITNNEGDGVMLCYWPWAGGGTTSDNIVTRNTITNTRAGIYIYDAPYNTISENNITENLYGIKSIYGCNNVFIGNNITENSRWDFVFNVGSDNSIYHNNLVANQSAIQTDSSNIWDDGYPSGGNYWSGYGGNDLYSGPYQNETGSDGIGDTPYVIDANNQDNYPLMNPWAPPIPKLLLEPSQATCRKYCEDFTLKINVSGASNVEDFEFEIHYNSTLLDYMGVTWDAWGTGTIDSSTDGILVGYTSGTPITGTATLVTLTFHAACYHLWKDCLGWINDLIGTIYFQWANLSYPDAPDLRYEKSSLDEIVVDPFEVTYTFSPIQGDVNNDGSVNILDISLVAWYYEQAYPAYDLNCDGIVDIFDLVIVAANLWYEYNS